MFKTIGDYKSYINASLTDHTNRMQCQARKRDEGKCVACTLWAVNLGVIIRPKASKAVCVDALKGLVLPRASHPGEIALLGSRRLRATAPVLFAHAVVTEANNRAFATPTFKYIISLSVPPCFSPLLVFTLRSQ